MRQGAVAGGSGCRAGTLRASASPLRQFAVPAGDAPHHRPLYELRAHLRHRLPFPPGRKPCQPTAIRRDHGPELPCRRSGERALPRLRRACHCTYQKPGVPCARDQEASGPTRGRGHGLTSSCRRPNLSLTAVIPLRWNDAAVTPFAKAVQPSRGAGRRSWWLSDSPGSGHGVSATDQFQLSVS